jgi:septation ring formation regulator EzrA
LICSFFILPVQLLLTFSFRVSEEKDQLIRQHQEELSAQRTSYQELKGQLIQLGFDHAAALKAAETAAAAKLHEALEDAGNSTAVLQAELEELAKARKAAEDKAARLEAGQKEYDQLIMRTDAHALRKFFPFSFSCFCL